MKAKPKQSEQDAPHGVYVHIKYGKLVLPKKRKPPSAASISKTEADDLITALADAARAIGHRGIVDDYSNYDFHLYPRHIVSLFPKDHTKHSACTAMDEESRAKFKQESSARVIVPWPTRGRMEEKTNNELREKPLEIIGLLMRKVLDGDSSFFEAIADAVRAAKIEAKKAAHSKDSPIHPKGKRRAGMVVASLPSYGKDGHSDWFTQIPKPPREGKAPFVIWSHCKACHDMGKPPPTRRDIARHLKSKGIICHNLRAQLARMNLKWLPEGRRSRKT
jgi:hypothetical protein